MPDDLPRLLVVEPVQFLVRSAPANVPIWCGTLIHTRLAAYITYVIAINLPNGAVTPALYWDTEEPYHYVRVFRKDQDSEELLIVGGEDHKTGQATNQAERWDRLEAWASARFPKLHDVRDRWSGEVIETLDGLALIGPAPHAGKNVFVAAGDSGMGLTHGTVAGLLLRDLILGTPNPWADTYAPNRLPVLAGGKFLVENLNMASQAGDWLTGGDVDNVAAIKPGQGAIIRRGLTKLALYRDEDGQLHEKSAVCPHLGCIVHWNDGEGTWDCPCHGSRFTGTGVVMHGPATSDLADAAQPIPDTLPSAGHTPGLAVSASFE